MNDSVSKTIARMEYPPLITQGKVYERPAVDCCIIGEGSKDVFYCLLDKKKEASICEIALKATQD